VPDAATLPIFWLIETVVAPVVLHVSMEAAPNAIEVGNAVNVAVGAGVDATVTVAVAVTEPAAFVAVRVYVVVAVGLTLRVPDTVTFPIF
jgi:hypothetical protein